MKNSYIKNWFSEFPSLRFTLSKEDKEVLDKINPADYKDHNLTRETEVIRIIDEHKPQAWKWVRLYPNLKNLTAEDYAILDHIVPNDFVGEVTEDDVRRVIAYRKDNLRKKKEAESAIKAKAYYERNKKAIEQEERTRTKLPKVTIFLTLLGIAFLTPGIRCLGTDIDAVPYLIIGAALIFFPWLYGALVLKKLDKNPVIPRNKPRKARMTWSSVMFIICYYAGVLGIGIALGTVLVWERLGFDAAEQTLYTGVIIVAASFIMFFISALATPSKD